MADLLCILDWCRTEMGCVLLDAKEEKKTLFGNKVNSATDRRCRDVIHVSEYFQTGNDHIFITSFNRGLFLASFTDQSFFLKLFDVPLYF